MLAVERYQVEFVDARGRLVAYFELSAINAEHAAREVEARMGAPNGWSVHPCRTGLRPAA